MNVIVDPFLWWNERVGPYTYKLELPAEKYVFVTSSVPFGSVE